MGEAQLPYILLADDDQISAHATGEELRRRGWCVDEVPGPDAALSALESRAYAIAVVAAPSEWLRRARTSQPRCRFFVLGKPGDVEGAVCALREGAFTVFAKPFPERTLADLAVVALSSEHPEDDIEVVSGSPKWIELRVRSRMTAVERTVQFLRDVNADLGADVRDDIAAALRELALNAVEYGAAGDPDQWIRVSNIRTPRALMCRIQDPGEGFSFDKLPHAAVSNPPDEPVRHAEIREQNGVRPGGFGIMLSRNLVDELIYNEKGNEVLFVKYLEGGKDQAEG